jgi:hypothetical protein
LHRAPLPWRLPREIYRRKPRFRQFIVAAMARSRRRAAPPRIAKITWI